MVEFKLHSADLASQLGELVVELESYRSIPQLKIIPEDGSTPPWLYFELKAFFQKVESVASSRIEGNRTTLLDYINEPQEKREKVSEPIAEILNIEQALEQIRGFVREMPLNHTFVQALHQLVVKGLDPSREGDEHPGRYRLKDVEIQGAKHRPPSGLLVQQHMDAFLSYLQQEVPKSQQLIQVAQAHHYFLYIHPFTNGNGRTARLLTVAMLDRYGYGDEIFTLNPSRVFGTDRTKYYDALALADANSEEGIEAWCIYFLNGLKSEFSTLRKLLDYRFAKQKILVPALKACFESASISKKEYSILKYVLDKHQIQTKDLEQVIGVRNPSQRSQEIGRIASKGLIWKATRGVYHFSILNQTYAPFFVKQLELEGLL